VLLAGAIEVNALAQGALRQFTQWLWIEHPGHFTTELKSICLVDASKTSTALKLYEI